MAKHRGRIQAQNGDLNESSAWDQEAPLTADEGHRRLNEVYARLTDAQRRQRERALDKAHAWIDACAAGGGVEVVGLPVSKPFGGPPGRRRLRIDIEVKAGKAFVPGKGNG